MASDLPPLYEDKHGGRPQINQLNSAEVVINASGHKQELERNFSLLSICGVGITTGNTWIAMGGSIVCCVLLLFSPHAGPEKYHFNGQHIDWC